MRKKSESKLEKFIYIVLKLSCWCVLLYFLFPAIAGLACLVFFFGLLGGLAKK